VSSANERLRIVVLGYIVRGPLGGLVWHHLQYVLGLQRLGHDVYFIEDSDDYPSCYDPSTHGVGTDPTYGLRFTEDVFSQFGINDRWGYYDAHTQRWLGPLSERSRQLCRNADIVLNLSGVNRMRPWIEDIPVRVLVDTDPVFTQIRHLRDENARREAAKHTSFFTFGENYSDADCHVPADGFPWQPTRQPLFPQAWPVTTVPTQGPLTTVLQWQSYPAVHFDGQRYGTKSDSFPAYQNLPTKVGSVLELAIGSETAPREALQRAGWVIRDPLEVTRTANAYQEYIQRSLGEFSVSKHGYVVSNSGWFSERSLVYLASGRPVITQDTGFSRWLPTGTGLLSFSTPEQATVAIESVRLDPHRHSQAAREIASEYFHYSQVLSRMIELAMTSITS
jgi:hypothetical protein